MPQTLPCPSHNRAASAVSRSGRECCRCFSRIFRRDLPGRRRWYRSADEHHRYSQALSTFRRRDNERYYSSSVRLAVHRLKSLVQAFGWQVGFLREPVQYQPPNSGSELLAAVLLSRHILNSNKRAQLWIHHPTARDHKAAPLQYHLQTGLEPAALQRRLCNIWLPA